MGCAGLVRWRRLASQASRIRSDELDCLHTLYMGGVVSNGSSGVMTVGLFSLFLSVGNVQCDEIMGMDTIAFANREID